MQFKDLGELFNSFGEMSSARFKGVTSISDMLGWQKDSFDEFLKLDSSGVSKYTMEEIKAKSAVLGLTDELTTQAVALAKDADFSAKAATGKLTYRDALKDNKNSITDIGKALEKSDKLNESWKESLQKAAKNGADAYETEVKKIININDDIADSVIDIGTSVQSSSTALSTYFKGILATIKPLVPAITAVAVAFAAFTAWDYSQHGFTRAQKDAENAASEYENVKSNLQSLNSELDTTKSKIQELEALQDNGTITLAQEVELENLKNTNNELERQVDIQKSLLKIKQKASAQAALNASKQQQTYTEAMEEEYGGFWGKIYGFLTDNGGTYVSNMTGKVVETGSKAEEWYKKYGNDSTVQGQVEGNIKALEEYNNELIDIENQLKDNPTDEALLSREEELNKLIDDTTTSLADQSTTLQSWIDACIDENGAIIEGYETQVEAWKTALTLIQNIGKSQKEIDLNNLNNYFSSTGGKTMKKYLEDIVKSGGNAEDALKAFKETGMSLDDIGVSSDGFVRYFQDLAKSATDASNAVEGFDGSLESIKKAGETDNRDKDWNTVSDLFNKAIELDKNKKWGTDDFQSMAQFIAPEGVIADIKNADLKAKDYKDLWDKYYSNFKKYFNSEKPLQSAINAQDKLISSGLAAKDKNGIVSWTESFKTSTDAAKAWGVSVEAAEVIMRNLESHGAEFDGIRFDNEELDKYKSSLEGIRSIYETLDDGAEKDRLGELLKSFESEYEIFEKDLTQLSEDQIVKIKFEYDLASIQQKIQELKDLATATGDNKDWAAVTVAQKQEREMLEEKTGYTRGSDSGYSSSYDKISNLRSDMVGKTEDERAAINAQISAIQELQNAFQSFRLDGGQLDWNNYLQSDEATKTLKEIEEATHLTKEQIAELFGLKPEDMKFSVDADTSEAESKINGIVSKDGKTITMNVDASTDEIKRQIENLQNGQHLLFTAEVDGEVRGIEAIRRQDGTIAYAVVDNGVKYYLEEHENVDGTINYTLGEVPTEVPPIDQEVYRIPNNTQINRNPSPVYQKVIRSVTGGASAGGMASGTMSYPSHAYGTAYNVINTKPISSSFANGKVSLSKDETALVNELGNESIIRDGKWLMLPPGMHMQSLKKGDIVLSATQTASLLNSGKASGIGHAYAHGTLLSSAYGDGMPYLGGSYGKSYGSTTTKASTTKNTSTTKAAQAVTKATENLVDFIKILLDRTQEVTKRLTDAIDDAVGLADKMAKNSSALSQIQKEISVNQQAYDKYMAQAGAVGLSESYASQVRNGSLNIENITNEDLKKKITDYQKWFEEAKNCQETIRQLQKDEQKLALSRLEYIEDFYDAVVKLNDAYKDVNDTHLEYLEKIGSSAITDNIKGYYQDSYAKEYDSYGKTLQQLADYTAEVNELISNGYLKEGSEDYLEAMKTIQEFTKQVDESAIALIELEDKIREIDYTKLQQIIDGSDRRTDQLKNAQALAEARDEQIGRDEYQKQIDELSKSINANYELRDKKLQEQNLYDVNSTRYQDLAKEIADLDGQIYDNLVDIEDLKNQIFEAEFFNYEKEQENLEYFIGELDDFSKLLNEEGFFDRNGAFTDEAYAKIALTAEAMAKCKQETANATEALKKLDEMYQNGLISETEYTDKQRDLLDTIRDSVSATEDYKNELLDLYKEQMEKSNNALKENISLRKEALKNAKDYEDYADSLKDKTKSVNELDSQINALQNANNSQARAELKRLIAQRDEAQKSLDDLKKEHTYDLMNEGYNIMSDNLDKSLQDIEYSISHSSEKQLQVVQSMLSQMVGSYSDAFNKISSIISNTGFVGTGSFNNTTSNIGSSTGSSSIASGATQDQSTIRPSDSVSNINSDNISNGQFDSVENEIKKEPNIDNRLCAELKISSSSVSIQEGSSTSISVSIRPNDAKNKTISWSSANSSIASVSSEGKITGVRPGSTTITASTTDGSGLIQTCKVTVTKKPDPPKPQTPTNSTTIQGNGVPDVGDKVTFVSGIYHEDSYGNGRWGNQGLGGAMYITKINPNSPYPIHISTGNRLGNGDRGWLRLNQLRGYRTGSRRINGSQWAWTQEDNKEEVIFRASDGAMLTPLGKGDTIFNNEQVQRLWEMSKGLDMSNFINLNTSNVIGSLPNIVNRNEMSQKYEVNMNFETLMTIEGNVSKDAIPGLQKEIDKMIPHISDKLGIYLRGELKR